VTLPPELAALLDERQRRGWSGTITLNLKDGAIIAFEVTEKHRIARPFESRDPRKVDSRGSPAT